MYRIKLAILFGGSSSEYEVSLQSAEAVIHAINPERYDLTLLGITRQGEWLKYNGPLDKIGDDTWMHHPSCVPAIISPDRQMRGVVVFEGEQVPTVIPIDVAFPVLHGRNGEDGTVQGLLELAGIPYVGCGILGSAVCMDKDIARRLVAAAGIQTPPSIVVHTPVSDAELLDRIEPLRPPLFVKPARQGSSIGITRVRDHGDAPAAITAAFEYDGKVVIEEAISGFEVGCAIIGNDRLIIGEVDEIELQDGFFDYTEKYTLKSSCIHMPARIDQSTADRIKDTAVRIYRILNCSGFARVDMFLTPDYEIVFNEVNTIPGFTPHSRFPNMLKGIGMSFEQIVDTVIRLAVGQ